MEATSKHRPPLIPWLAYNFLAVPAWWSGFHLARLFDEKAEASLAGRRQLFQRLDHQRSRLQGCLWFHASSAGEVEQCRPLLRAARDSRLNSRPTLLTVYSPSGFAHATEHAEADHVEYLPLDTLWSCDRMMRWLQPSALIYLRYDAWPNLVWTARAARVPLFLVSATLSAQSRRHHRGFHGFFSSVYRAFDRIGCLSEDDARAFVDLYSLSPERVSVTGDSRFDQVLERSAEAANAPLVGLLRAQSWRYMVLGSTWPADDRITLSALTQELAEYDRRGLVLVPHEPTPTALASLEERLRGQGIASRRWSELVELHTGRRRSTAAARDDQSWRVIIVDAVGILAELYHAADLAYVGGGFGAGVHSVLEAAAAGIPVLFGPRHQRSREATHLIDREAGACIRNASDLSRELRRYREASACDRAGENAQSYLTEASGAAERNLALVESVLFRESTRLED
jgi:3-deoxy-D-manno-octulosonic-acid transferase